VRRPRGRCAACRTRPRARPRGRRSCSTRRAPIAVGRAHDGGLFIVRLCAGGP
jgi:hypothetical protein